MIFSGNNKKMKQMGLANSKGQKLQFRFPADAVSRLDVLKEKTLATSRAEVVRNALRVYEFLVEQVENGVSLQLVKDNETKTIVPLPL